MLSNLPNTYERPQATELRRRLAEPRRLIQVVAGPRQVGRTTLVQQLIGDEGIALEEFLSQPVSHWIQP